MRAISEWRGNLSTLGGETSSTGGDSDPSELFESNNIRVCVRVRPIFQRELDAGEFDVISAVAASSRRAASDGCRYVARGSSGDTTHSKVACHDARMHPDMRRMFMHHHEFDFDRVFGADATNDGVCVRTGLRMACRAHALSRVGDWDAWHLPRRARLRHDAR